MIKKILILAILGGLGYVGYLVWGNLSPKEKDVVSRKAGDVVDGAKDLAGKAADRLTGVAKDGIKKIDASEMKDGKKDKDEAKPDEKAEEDKKDETQPAEKPAAE